MHVTLNPREASRALQTAVRHTPRKGIIEHLSGALLTAEGDTITIRATDLETDVRIRLPATVAASGTCLVPARLLLEIMSSVDGDAASLKLSGNELHITSGKTGFAIVCMDPKDFPAPLAPEPEVFISLPAETLSSAMSRVLHAMSRDETRPILRGVRLALAGTNLQLAATDGARLATVNIPVAAADPADAQAAATLPADAASAIAHDLPAETATLALGKETAVAESGSLTLSTRLVPGGYPAISPVIQEAARNPIEVKVPTDELARAVELALLTARGEARVVRIHVSPAEMLVESSTAEVGHAMVPVPGATLPETPLSVNLNGAYLLEALRAVRSPTMVLLLKDPLRPVLIRSGDDQDSYMEILAPVRVY
jgi:DNA polymerase-3 subunit beta